MSPHAQLILHTEENKSLVGFILVLQAFTLCGAQGALCPPSSANTILSRGWLVQNENANGHGEELAGRMFREDCLSLKKAWSPFEKGGCCLGAVPNALWPPCRHQRIGW